ncbi:hypothetical protein BLNAU_4453 [Blattamonas nauphoetae]|uniref:Homeobox domain-containing protein n=1 Tax=Blattamonas nauphoetae TaxID=2049346 RepID=A0ABQ9Y9Z9_9EUKA|nr:hypothetical protein BLNAU_4453 [Blattamonas nauphoetae]
MEKTELFVRTSSRDFPFAPHLSPTHPSIHSLHQPFVSFGTSFDDDFDIGQHFLLQSDDHDQNRFRAPDSSRTLNGQKNHSQTEFSSSQLFVQSFKPYHTLNNSTDLFRCHDSGIDEDLSHLQDLRDIETLDARIQKISSELDSLSIQLGAENRQSDRDAPIWSLRQESLLISSGHLGFGSSDTFNPNDVNPNCMLIDSGQRGFDQTFLDLTPEPPQQHETRMDYFGHRASPLFDPSRHFEYDLQQSPHPSFQFPQLTPTPRNGIFPSFTPLPSLPPLPPLPQHFPLHQPQPMSLNKPTFFTLFRVLGEDVAGYIFHSCLKLGFKRPKCVICEELDEQLESKVSTIDKGTDQVKTEMKHPQQESVLPKHPITYQPSLPPASPQFVGDLPNLRGPDGHLRSELTTLFDGIRCVSCFELLLGCTVPTSLLSGQSDPCQSIHPDSSAPTHTNTNDPNQLPQPLPPTLPIAKPPAPPKDTFPRWARGILVAWYTSRSLHGKPYLTDQEKVVLGNVTGLTWTQITDWVSNKRNRDRRWGMAKSKYQKKGKEKGEVEIKEEIGRGVERGEEEGDAGKMKKKRKGRKERQEAEKTNKERIQPALLPKLVSFPSFTSPQHEDATQIEFPTFGRNENDVELGNSYRKQKRYAPSEEYDRKVMKLDFSWEFK